MGLTKYGVAEYAAPTKVKIDAPLRPPEITVRAAQTNNPERALRVLEDRAPRDEVLRLM